MHINFSDVKFSRSYGSIEQLPASIYPEVSFAGRSNVGKSSLINCLFNRKSLAKVSSTPGKTATINFFETSGVHFVDLPGYGYAQVPEADKERWARLIEGYFTQKRRFALVCSLVDIRHNASPLDFDMIAFLKKTQLPFAVVLTKGDKLGPVRGEEQRALLREQLEVPDEVEMVITSSLKAKGMDVMHQLITKAAEKA